MDRLSFLKEEFASVQRALREALRHDYGPERSKEFYNECATRLASIGDAIEATVDMSASDVADHLRALASVGSRVALLERSHLGEFSWPFTDAIRDFAENLFKNEEASGEAAPIVHVISEGIGYQIFDDDPDRMFRKRIMIVAFPRQLRHHVLLHAIFGHELGHPATKSDNTMAVIFGPIMSLLRRGPMQDDTQINAWLAREDAPAPIRRQISKKDVNFSDEQLEDWRLEIFCDLFGLVLFGPSFAAAHRMILEPLCAPPDEYDFSSDTHPPYPLRKRIIADAMRLLGWLEPVIEDECAARSAEFAMLAYAGGDPPDEWTRLLADEDLRELLGHISAVFEPFPGIAYVKPKAAHLKMLLDRLVHCRPPIVQWLDEGDRPRNAKIPIQHCLYAGWVFWFGMEELRKPLVDVRPDLPELDFFLLNRLCEQGLLQQRAIDRMPDVEA